MLSDGVSLPRREGMCGQVLCLHLPGGTVDPDHAGEIRLSESALLASV